MVRAFFLKRSNLAAFAIAAVSLAVFSGAVGHDFTTWDDNVYVTDNPGIEDLSPSGLWYLFTSFHNCNYHPLTSLTYRLEHAVAGFAPWLYHLDNVLLHAAASVLAFLLCRRWLGSSTAAWGAALLFSVHPLRVESVAWISERKDVLCTMFYLAALLAYSTPGRHGAPRRYHAALAFFALALLSKVMAVTLPVVLVLLLVRERKLERAELLRLVPFFVLGVGFTVIGVAAQASGDGIKDLRGADWLTHILTIPVAISLYAQKLVIPVVLSPRYVVAPPAGILDPRVVAGTVILALGTWAAWRSFPRRGAVFFGLAFFAVTWAPVSGIVPSSTLVADRYIYLPSLGLFTAFAGALCAGLRSGSFLRLRLARCGSVLAALLALWCLLLTPLRVACWKDGLTLWSDALGENPRNSLAYNQLATFHFLRGRYAEAATAVTEAARCGLDSPRYLFNLCMAYRGMGDRERERAAARAILERAPDFLPAWSVELRYLRESGKSGECRRILDELERMFSGDPILLAARGDLEMAEGRVEKGLVFFLQSVERDPGDLEARLAASFALFQLGQRQKAVRFAQMALARHHGPVTPGARLRLAALRRAAARAGAPGLEDRLRDP